MARRVSKHLRPPRPLLSGHASAARKADGVWVTRTIPGGRSDRDYTCPGCNQTVAAGTPHVVVWPHEPPLGSTSGVEHRRHWHNGCWSRRQ